MWKKFLRPLTALTLIASVATATAVQPAEAGRRGLALGIGAGIVTLGVLGAISEARARDRYHARHRHYDGYDRSCYRGRRRCRRVGGGCYYNDYGEEVCRRGRLRCWPPRYCD